MSEKAKNTRPIEPRVATVVMKNVLIGGVCGGGGGPKSVSSLDRHVPGLFSYLKLFTPDKMIVEAKLLKKNKQEFIGKTFTVTVTIDLLVTFSVFPRSRVSCRGTGTSYSLSRSHWLYPRCHISPSVCWLPLRTSKVKGSIRSVRTAYEHNNVPLPCKHEVEVRSFRPYV